ncbi:MAG: amino acid ABC transporter permease [Alphaproteobacteria bacterium]
MFKIEAILPELPYLLYGIPLTLAITAGAFGAGVVLSLPMALVRLNRTPVLNALTVGWIEFFRTTPPLVHIVWAYYVFPVLFDLRLSAVTVVIAALAANVSAQMAEVFRAGIQSIPRGQREAAKVLGLGPGERLWYVILPQTVRLIMAPSANALVGLLKESSLAAVIAVPELMARGQLVSTHTFRPLEVLTLVAVLYFVLTYPLALAAGALERRSKLAFRTL